jgi:hypothetical protein
MILPTAEQISGMTMSETELVIKLLDQHYGLDRTIERYTDEIDAAVNILCDITQRQEQLRHLAGVEAATATYHARRQP